MRISYRLQLARVLNVFHPFRPIEIEKIMSPYFIEKFLNLWITIDRLFVCFFEFVIFVKTKILYSILADPRMPESKLMFFQEHHKRHQFIFILLHESQFSIGLCSLGFHFFLLIFLLSSTHLCTLQSQKYL